MATTPEGRVKVAIKAYLKTLPDCWWYMPVQNGMGVGGIPDIIICLGGLFVAIEVKAPGREKSTTPLQECTIAAINNAGGHALVVSDVEDVIALVVALRLANAMRTK